MTIVSKSKLAIVCVAELFVGRLNVLLGRVTVVEVSEDNDCVLEPVCGIMGEGKATLDGC